jgi:hypothetical protein
VQCPECTSHFTLLPVKEQPPVKAPALREPILGADGLPITLPGAPLAAQVSTEEAEAGGAAEPAAPDEVAVGADEVRAPAAEPGGDIPRGILVAVTGRKRRSRRGTTAQPQAAVAEDPRGADGLSQTDQQSPARPVPAVEEDEAPAPALRFDPLGQGALALGGAALLCAFVTRLGGLVVPLSALGLAWGLAVLVLTGAARGARLWPAAGAALSGLLLVAVLAPGFDTLFGGSRRAAVLDPGALRVVPLTGHAIPDGVANAEWVDAGQAAVQMGDVGVQVVSATVGPVEVRPAPGRRAVSGEKVLTVRLKSQRVGGTLKLTGEDDAESAPKYQRPQVKLTDETGKVYREQPAVPTFGPAAPPWTPPFAAPWAAAKAGGPPLPVAAAPGAAVEEVYVFEAPPAAVKALRLEVPAAAWGYTGAFKFKVPIPLTPPEPAATKSRLAPRVGP